MLVIFISAAWLAITATVVILCRCAAQADALAVRTPALASSELGAGALADEPLRTIELTRVRNPHDPRPRERRQRGTSGTAGTAFARGRGGRCATGS